VALRNPAQLEHLKEELLVIQTVPTRLTSQQNCNSSFLPYLMQQLRILKVLRQDILPVITLEEMEVVITQLSIRQHNVNASSTIQFKEKA
jgi:hypothetical protein